MRGGQFRPGPGVEGPPPAAGFARFWFILKNHFRKLILANFLFLIFSIPVITIPAALCGLNSVCSQLMRTGKCYLGQDFLDGFRRRFLAKTLFGLPFCAVIGGTVLLYVAGMRRFGAGFYAAAIVACYFFLAACFFFASANNAGSAISKSFPEAFFLIFRKLTWLRLLPALALAVLFTVFYITLLPILLIIGMSLITLLAQIA